MSTNDDFMSKFEWNNNIKNRAEKEVLARKIAARVNDGDVISFGSGTTSFLAVKEIGKRCSKEGLSIIAIPTSKQIEELCEYLKIKTAKLGEYEINWGFDGADEVDKNNWLIKGLGGALYKEKMNFKQTPIVYILVDKSKIVDELGQKCAVPVECDKDKIEQVTKELFDLGATKCEVRKQKDSEENYITDNDNVIIDAKFSRIDSDMEKKINNIDGVLDNGLFINYENIEVIVA